MFRGSQSCLGTDITRTRYLERTYEKKEYRKKDLKAAKKKADRVKL